MHMDGSAMSAIIKVAFLFGMFGQDFTTGRAILAIIVAVFSSVAMSGIPGGGGTGELVLCSIFFPDHLAVAFPIALALGNLVDPPRPWSTPRATTSSPSSSRATSTARIGCRSSWQKSGSGRLRSQIKHTFSAGVPCSRAHRRLCPLTPEKFLGFHIFPVSHFCAFYLFWDNFAE
ncbi:MAG: cation:dicarboxylate symporter family transporter [Oscillospiraceae bacterium]